MTAPVSAASDEQSPAPQDLPAPEAADAAPETSAELPAGDEGPTEAPGGDQRDVTESPVSEAPVAEAPAAEAPVKAMPDRADAPVSEVTERFLRAVVASVPVELIEELHLFSPLRQGTVETGIAVLAARVPIALAEESDEPELPFAAEAEAVAVIAGAGSANDESPDGASVGDEEVIVAVEHAGDDTPLGDETIVVDDDEDVSMADAPVADASADERDEAEAIIDTAIEAAPVKAARPVRHTVYTARYRYVIKGPERGKWESNVKAEADAPLITVETVVRGVQRRAGEESEIVRYSGAQVARALRLPYNA